MHINTDPCNDTYDEREYADLCRIVSATIVGNLTVAVQTAVTNAFMLKGENWRKEALALLERHGSTDAPQLCAAN